MMSEEWCTVALNIPRLTDVVLVDIGTRPIARCTNQGQTGLVSNGLKIREKRGDDWYEMTVRIHDVHSNGEGLHVEFRYRHVQSGKQSDWVSNPTNALLLLFKC